MNILQESLYWITSGLLVPCIVFLLFMLIQCLFEVGSNIAKKTSRQEALKELQNWVSSNVLTPITLPQTAEKLISSKPLTQILTSNDLTLNRLLISQFESDIEKLLSRYSNFAKLGAIAGLVGTLIPMGPALKGLADGNIQQLAGQMQIAFTTTVIGLIVGAIGLLLYQIHKRQAFAELTILDFVLEKQEVASEK